MGKVHYEKEFNKAVAELNDDIVELGPEEAQVILRAGIKDRTIEPQLATMIQNRLDSGRELTATMEKALVRAGNIALEKSGRDERLESVAVGDSDNDARSVGRRLYQNPLNKAHTYTDRYDNTIILKASDIMARCRELVKSRKMDLKVATMIENRINKGIPIKEDTLYRMFEQD